MRIIRDNKVYVQKNDIVYLNQSSTAIPASIYTKAIGNGLYVNDSNRLDFIEFVGESEVEFFRALDWLIDYDDVKYLKGDEMIELGQSIMKKRNGIAERFNSMSDEEKEKNIDMIEQCEALDFKFYSLRDILWFKQGHIKMKLPEVLKNGDAQKSDNKVLRLVRSIFRK